MAQIGEDGKKYGLILTGKSAQPNKPQAISHIVSRVFSQGDDDDADSDGSEENFKQIKTGQCKMQSRMQKQTQIVIENAMKEDPKVFLYDEMYEEMSSTAHASRREAEGKSAAKERKSKYAANLLKTAATRQIERDLVEERKVQKEREAEGTEFADKPVFVSESYKQKMKERQEMMRELEARTSNEDVTKQEDLTHFYRSILDTRTTAGPAAAETPDAVPSPQPKEAKSEVKKSSTTLPRSYRPQHEQRGHSSEEEKDEDRQRQRRRGSPDRRQQRSSSSEGEERKKDDRKSSRDKDRSSRKARPESETRTSRRKENDRQTTREDSKKVPMKSRLVIPPKDENKITEARARFMERKARSIGPVIESDSD